MGIPYRTIEAAGTEPESLSDVLKEEISFNLSLQSDLFNESGFAVIYPSLIISQVKLTKHTGGDIYASPDISLIVQDLA